MEKQVQAVSANLPSVIPHPETQQSEAQSIANNESSNSKATLLPRSVADMNSTHAVSTFVPQSRAGLESQIETPVTQVIESGCGNGDVTCHYDEGENRITPSHPRHHYEDGLHTLDSDDQFDTRFEYPRPAPPIPLHREVIQDNSSTTAISNINTRRFSRRGANFIRSLIPRSR